MTYDRDDLTPAWDAFIAPTERIALDNAMGRVAASTIRQYPPGIPEIIPGMRYSSHVVERLEKAHSEGVDIIGVNMDADRQVEVLVETEAKRNDPVIQTFDAQSISDIVANEIADYFRTGFSAAPYFHFAFHESDPLQSLPHTLDFDAYTVSIALSDPEKRRVCQETIRESAYKRALNSKTGVEPDKIILPDGFHLWTHKELCRKHIKDRLSDPGYVTLVREQDTQELIGLLHSRMGSVARLFASEEWSDPLLFSTHKDETIRDDPDRFFKKMEYHFDLKPHDSLMTISAQLLNPDIQGGEIFYKMMRSMALKIKAEHAALPILSEIPTYGTAHTLNAAMNHRLVFGVLKNGHPVVFCSQMSQALFPLINERSHWRHILKKAAREKQQYRKQYYISLPTDHAAVTVRPNGKLGLAVFATKDIAADTRIAIFTGEKYASKTALGLPEIMRDHAIQTGLAEFVFGYRGLAQCLCHSCDPNCGIRNRTEIYTIKAVSKGEQLTWDYRCSENSDWVLDNCLCGTDRCTGSVKNFDSLPQNMKDEYLSRSMVSDWIVSTLSDD